MSQKDSHFLSLSITMVTHFDFGVSQLYLKGILLASVKILALLISMSQNYSGSIAQAKLW